MDDATIASLLASWLESAFAWCVMFWDNLDLWTLLAIALLIACSALFSGSETAITAASPHRIHQWAQEGSRRARLMRRLMDQRGRLISTILLGNNLVNILASALFTSFLVSRMGSGAVATATLVMTLVILVFAEILPKTLALGRAERMALTLAPLLRFLLILFAPAISLINGLVTGLLRMFGHRPRQASRRASGEELRGAISLLLQGVHEEQAMLHSILDLRDVQVGEIMTHRNNVQTLDIDDAEIWQKASQSPYSRLPVWRDQPDNIIGILLLKDLLRSHAAPQQIDAAGIEALLSRPWFVPETTALIGQLQAFRARQGHFALVVDEYGTFQGIVTLEDILEEIVGDISDEHDLPVAGVRPAPGGGYLIDGAVTIRDLNRKYGWRLPDDHASTIAGLVLHEARALPNVGQTFTFYDFRFEILTRQRNQITALRVIPPKSAPTDWSALPHKTPAADPGQSVPKS
ncbi:MAG: HlyC/CorC family transporter [Pseudomonadota bacterium]